jgi:dGTPase
MDAATLSVMNELRDFMFRRVYLASDQRARANEAVDLLRRLMDWYLEHPDELPGSYRDVAADRVTQAADHVAGMTDRYAQRKHEQLFGWPGIRIPAS